MNSFVKRLSNSLCRLSIVAGAALAFAAQAPAKLTYSASTDGTYIYTASCYPSGSKLRVSKRDYANTTYWVKDFSLASGWTPAPGTPLPQVQNDSSGNVFVAFAIQNSSGHTKIQISKVASTGLSVTTKTYDPSSLGDATLSGLAVDASGNAYIDGDYLVSGGDRPTYAVKYTSTLATGTARTPPVPPNLLVVVSDIITDSSGNAYVAQTGVNTVTSVSYFVVTKYNSSFGATPTWQTVTAFPSAMMTYSSGGVLTLSGTSLTYVTQGGNSTLSPLVANQINTSTGASNWVATVGSVNTSLFAAMVDSNGDIIMSGPNGTTAYSTFKVDGTTGGLLWANSITKSSVEPRGICQDASGDYLVVYPYASGSNFYSVVDRFTGSTGANSATYTFSSVSSKDYGFAIFPVPSNPATFLVSGVGYSGSAYYPLVYRSGTGSWYNYQTATTP